jgi:hypothetical protein
MRYVQSGLGIGSYLPCKILCLYFCGFPRLRNFCELVGLVLFDARQERLLGSALSLAEIEDRRSVALENVTQGSLAVSTLLEFDKGVTLWNPVVFSQASRRAPAAARETPSEGGIQSASVNTGLSSGEDLRQPHPLFFALPQPGRGKSSIKHQ